MGIITLTASAQEWTGLGLTAGDWCAVITLVVLLISSLGGLLIVVLRDKLTNPLSAVITKLSDTVDRLIDANRQRDRQYEELTRHVAKHDRQFVRDEERINEIFRRIKGDNKNE